MFGIVLELIGADKCGFAQDDAALGQARGDLLCLKVTLTLLQRAAACLLYLVLICTGALVHNGEIEKITTTFAVCRLC